MTSPSSILPQGRLGNLAKAAFVPTPPSVAKAIFTNLLRIKDPQRTPVLDPAAGEGDLLLPAFQCGLPCFGVEIDRVRAAWARARLPGATILAAPFEAVRARGRFSLVLTNPPYLGEGGGKRMEHFFVTQAGAWLRPGGILVAVIPARSAWTGLIEHLVRHYEDIRVWRLPEQVEDGPGFDEYTQLIVCGRRREKAVTPASPQQFAAAQAEVARLQEIAFTNGTWQNHELPASPLPDPYEVPPGVRMPSLILEVESTDPQLIWQLLSQSEQSGLEHSPRWREATEGQDLQEEADQPQELAIPYSSGTLAHVAAKILSGALNGRLLRGLPGQGSSPSIFQAFVIQQWNTLPLSPEEEEELRQRGVQRAYQQVRQELPVVGLLSRDSWQYLTGAEALRFLAQAQEELVQQLLSLPHRIDYPLDPTDRELGILLQIGRDKQLAGWPWPGLVDQQIHTILGMYRALGRSPILLQAEPGTGKTRMCTALAALLAEDWRQRRPGQRWIKRLRRAWLRQPFLRGLLGKAGTDQVVRPQDAGPSSLPVLVTTPLRVALEYQREVEACWPEAEVHLVRTVDEVRAWLQRCATSDAPAVVGILPHSRAQAIDLSWRPAVIQRKRGQQTLFCCPGCGQVVTARPWQAIGEAAGEEEDSDRETLAASELPPVGSRRWFELRPRWHRCPDGKRTGLFTYCRRPETERRFKPLAFAEWSRLITHHRPPDHVHGWWLSVVGEKVKWSKAPATVSLSPFEWLYRFARGAIGLVIVDESHNARSQSADLARCIQLVLAAGQQGVLASGTHYGGNLESLFHYWFRLIDPGMWKQWGLGWNDVDRARERFGMIRCVVKEYDPPPSSKKRRGDMIVHTSTSSAPGISVRLLPFLLSRMVLLSLQDIGVLLPRLREIPILVSLQDSQVQAAWTRAAQLREQARLLRRQAANAREEGETEESDELEEEAQRLLEEANDLEEWSEARDLHRAYLRLCTEMEEKARTNHTVRMACATLPRWFVCLPCDRPFQLLLTRRTAWGEERDQELALTTPVLAWEHFYPQERELQQIIRQELAEQRLVLVYVDQSVTRSMARRLSYVLREWERWLWSLPDQVKPEERQQAIWEAVAQGKRVIVAQYRAVSEGLNLQFLDTIVWYELPLNLFLLDQASRRCWRLGRQGEVRIYYLAYAGTPAHAKLMSLGQRHGAATAFAGQLVEGELSAAAAADQTSLAQLTACLASSVAASPPAPSQEDSQLLRLLREEGAEVARAQEQLSQAFERRHAMLQSGRQWLGGFKDTLRERLAQWHRRLSDEVPPAQDPTCTEGSRPPAASEEGTRAEAAAPPAPQPAPSPQSLLLEEQRLRIEIERPAAPEVSVPPSSHIPVSPAAASQNHETAASAPVQPDRSRPVFGDTLLSAIAPARRRRRASNSVASAVQTSLWDLM